MGAEIYLKSSILILKSVLSNDFSLCLARRAPMFAARISQAARAFSCHNRSSLLFSRAVRKADSADKAHSAPSACDLEYKQNLPL